MFVSKSVATQDHTLVVLDICCVVFSGHTFRLVGPSQMDTQASKIITPMSSSRLPGSFKRKIISDVLKETPSLWVKGY